jgi:hypothetical protein
MVKTSEANTLATSSADLEPLGHRLTRARDNCFKTLPASSRRSPS